MQRKILGFDTASGILTTRMHCPPPWSTSITMATWTFSSRGFVDFSKMPAGDPSHPPAFSDDFPGLRICLLRNDGTESPELLQPQKFPDRQPRRLRWCRQTRQPSDIDLLVVNTAVADTVQQSTRRNVSRRSRQVGLNAKGRFTCAARVTSTRTTSPILFGPSRWAGLVCNEGWQRPHRHDACVLQALEGSAGAQFLDYDNDGLLTLLLMPAKLSRLSQLGTRWET